MPPSYDESFCLKRGDLVWDNKQPTALHFQVSDIMVSQWRRVGRITKGLDVVDAISVRDKIIHCGLLIRN